MYSFNTNSEERSTFPPAHQTHMLNQEDQKLQPMAPCQKSKLPPTLQDVRSLAKLAPKPSVHLLRIESIVIMTLGVYTTTKHAEVQAEASLETGAQHVLLVSFKKILVEIHAKRVLLASTLMKMLASTVKHV